MNKKMVVGSLRMAMVIACMALGATAFAADPASAPQELADSGGKGAAIGMPSVEDLTKPRSTVEAGVGVVSRSNWKFGEYNGLNGSGAYGAGGFDVRGGGAYDSEDATRWRVIGKDLGLETRDLSGEYGKQGLYRFNFNYDELLKGRNNTFMTPYNGVGGNNLTLPANWAYPKTANNMRTLPGANYNQFNQVDLNTKRTKYDGGWSYLFDSEWEFKARIRHEDKNGLRAIGAPLVANRAVILPSPVDTATEQFDGSLNYTGKNGFIQAAYYGTLFRNNIDSITFQNAFSATTTPFGRMSSEPDNQFHQGNITAGYHFTPTTKLVGSFSRGINTQNQSFLPYNTLSGGGGALPATSLGAEVDTTAFDIKLTTKPFSKFNVAANYKFDERDNHTPINMYSFSDVDSGAAANNFRTNTPFSKLVHKATLEGDYNVAKGQWLKTGYDWQQNNRWCNGSWISCVDAGTTNEHTGRFEIRSTLTDWVNGRVGYAYSRRDAESYNQDNAYLASFGSPGVQALYNKVAATGLGAWGPALGFPIGGVSQPFPAVFANNNPATGFGAQNAVDITGMRRFNMADRDRHKIRSNLDFKLSDKWSFDVSGEFNDDTYPNSPFGLQSANSWVANADTSYQVTETLSTHLFYTYQDQTTQSAGRSYGNNSNAATGTGTSTVVNGGCFATLRTRNNNAKIDPCLNWFGTMSDQVDTIGLGAKRTGMLNGKFDLTGDLLFSFAQTMNDFTGGRYLQPSAANGAPANPQTFFISAANMPVVNTDVIEFKLDGKYQLSKKATLHLSYLYQHLRTNDYVFIGTQPAGTPTGVMPTFEVSPNYAIHTGALTYIYNF